MNQAELSQKLLQAQTLLGECLKNLSATPKGFAHGALSAPSNDLKFNQNERPFFKQNVVKKMNGQKKFTLVVAYLAEGKINKQVKLTEVEKTWKKAKKFILTEFHSEYGTRAKDEEYLLSPKQGVYTLADSWKNIFN
ncbi:hypothetical protein A2303_00345 [Candidatus Falkowbacteria bacterium RIFOXYB2_FULL_47_14]|uniref:Uncharacterized protein n=1 Tax=Candidatus Falkowbacteria bacterium RIFOXYA2_FULL_47_19 TaxID=1797994 RepID=A0A1F5SNA9_9BACT|nr:MAG: hypothetical protein A2227_05380 [Candidatus Falkowbacteria bacterium RIFOXYA2_FULL_47_19]OGF43008.1 MAG: hypothetical protein A2303_00345 [Candidatus Falkowbacteria bacterium RIFOXYB2_FULL_47_14]